MHRSLLLLFAWILVTGIVSCKSLHRDERDITTIPQTAAANRQIGGGLTALGTLISPLLFLMGMGSFVSMLPQMFQSVLGGVGSNLIQSFTGGAASAASPSSRLKRSPRGHQLLNDDLLNEIENRLNLAVLKNERPH